METKIVKKNRCRNATGEEIAKLQLEDGSAVFVWTKQLSLIEGINEGDSVSIEYQTKTNGKGSFNFLSSISKRNDGIVEIPEEDMIDISIPDTTEKETAKATEPPVTAPTGKQPIHVSAPIEPAPTKATSKKQSGPAKAQNPTTPASALATTTASVPAPAAPVTTDTNAEEKAAVPDPKEADAASAEEGEIVEESTEIRAIIDHGTYKEVKDAGMFDTFFCKSELPVNFTAGDKIKGQFAFTPKGKFELIKYEVIPKESDDTNSDANGTKADLSAQDKKAAQPASMAPSPTRKQRSEKQNPPAPTSAPPAPRYQPDEAPLDSNPNLKYYNTSRKVPASAQKPFNNGRFSGTDINPVWRIKKLTEMFGPAGIGWYTELTDKWLEAAPNGEIKAFVNINLYVKVDGEWSKPIFGTGGNSFCASTKSGLVYSDECYKMAYTDAISVACKALGIGADVYWQDGQTKYTN